MASMVASSSSKTPRPFVLPPLLLVNIATFFPTYNAPPSVCLVHLPTLFRICYLATRRYRSASCVMWLLLIYDIA